LYSEKIVIGNQSLRPNIDKLAPDGGNYGVDNQLTRPAETKSKRQS